MPKFGKNQRRGVPQARPRQGGVPVQIRPAPFRANVEHRHVFRFTSTNATSASMTDNEILTAAGVIATSATVGAAIHSSFKIHRVTIWSPPASQGASTTCSLNWVQVVEREISDTSVSTAVPAYLTSVPPAGSQAAFWNSNQGTTLFSMVAPVGSIIDIDLTLIMQDNLGSASAVLVGATVGNAYYCCLDSNTNATGIYKPVSLTVL